MVICLERDADLHVAQLMPMPLTVSCFSKIQIGFTFLVPAHPGVCGCVLLTYLLTYVDDYTFKRVSRYLRRSLQARSIPD